MIDLRPYQRDCVDAIFRDIEAHDSTLAILATGLGKSVIIGGASARFVRESASRVLVVQHREELLYQNKQKIELASGLRVSIEMADERDDRLAPVCVASVPSLHAKRLATFAPDTFGLLVVDEAHHAAAASYRAIRAHFARAKYVGFTATADRLDGEHIGFDSIAYTMGILEGIEAGWLVRPRARVIKCAALNGIANVRTVAGDLELGALSAVMEAEDAIEAVAEPLLAHAEDRQTIGYATSIKHAHRLAAALNAQRPGCAMAIDGSMSKEERRDILARFRDRDFQFLINCQLLTEGVDVPDVACIAIVRPTQSRAQYTQMVGRGTRPAKGKTDLLVLDFVGVARRHSLVCMVDVLAPDANEEQRAAAADLIDRGDCDDPIEALGRARLRLHHGEDADVDPFRAPSKSAIEAARVLGVRLGQSLPVDPTDRQIEILRKHGIDETGLDKHQASRLIGGIIGRSQLGLATLRQVKRLRASLGDAAFSLTRAQASAVLDAIAANGWKPLDRARCDELLGVAS